VSGAAKVNDNRLLEEKNLAFIGCAVVGAAVVDDDVVELLREASCCRRIAATIGGEVVVEPPSAVGIIALLMSMKLQVLR
jgi:hypothetical protein